MVYPPPSPVPRFYCTRSTYAITRGCFMVTDLSNHYRVVLDDLRHRRSSLVRELEEIDASINVLQRQGNVSGSNASESGHSLSYSLPPTKNQPNYSHMSVRWAILWLLSDLSPQARKTGDIARALRDGGYPTTMGDRFSNSVSAVLSAMKVKGEVETVEDGAYRITQTGREVWDHISTTDRFKLTQVA